VQYASSCVFRKKAPFEKKKKKKKKERKKKNKIEKK
jgi:hypothetical protein